MFKLFSIIHLLLVFLVASDTFYYSKSKKIYLTPLEIQSRMQKSSVRNLPEINYFKTSNDTVVGVTNRLIVKFKNITNLDSIQKRFKLTMVKKMFGNTYLFELQGNTLTLDIANELYILDDIVYAHPSFIKEIRKR